MVPWVVCFYIGSASAPLVAAVTTYVFWARDHGAAEAIAGGVVGVVAILALGTFMWVKTVRDTERRLLRDTRFVRAQNEPR